MPQGESIQDFCLRNKVPTISLINGTRIHGIILYILISTCRMNGISALDYLKRFFREIVKGRMDYENLLPMTIVINTNKL